MSADRADKPVTDQWRAWKLALDKLEQTKAKTLATPSMHGVKWELKMKHHYDKMIAQHRLREPDKYKV